MKKAVSLILVFTFCLFSFVSAVSAENKVEMYDTDLSNLNLGNNVPWLLGEE